MTKYSEDFQQMDRSSFNDIRRYPSRPQPPSCSCNQPPPPPPPLPSFGHGCNNPIFAGKKPLAYLEDLAALHGEVLKWLIGPDGEFSNNGYAPLNKDGKIDEKYFSQIGIDTYEKDHLIKDNATRYNFIGDLVHVENVTSDSLGDIVNIYIGKNKNPSEIGTDNGTTNGKLKLDFDLIDMIVPDVSMTDYHKQVYGNWAPGTIVKGFNAKNKSTCTPTDMISVSTEESVYFSSLDTKFVLTVFDSNGKVLAIAETAYISGTNPNVPLIGDNKRMIFEVSNFEKAGFGYAGKIKWSINIAGLLGYYGGRFGLQISHVQNDDYTVVWRSEDYFYNTGNAPTIGGLYEKIVETLASDPNYKPEYIYSSGLKYLNKGKIYISAYDVDNLNSNAAVADKFSIAADFLDLDNYVYSDSDFDGYSLDIDLINTRYIHAFDVKENILTFKPTQYEVTIRNASGNVTAKKESHILINTLRNPETSTQLIETFNDESHRCSVDFITDETGITLENWHSDQSLEIADKGRRTNGGSRSWFNVSNDN